MDPALLTDLLKAIKDAVSSNRRPDEDVALPTFDPTTSDSGAEGWCKSIEELAKEFGWSSLATIAKAGKALKGSALVWFESWEPSTGGKTWEKFRNDITDLYPEKRNLAEKLSMAVAYTSDLADSYCEYAREKIRLYRNTKISFTQEQLIELVCGSITDVNVRMASFNSNVKTTSELISLFSSYIKPKKRPSEQSYPNSNGSGPSSAKRPKFTSHNQIQSDPKDKRCFTCGRSGHVRSQCRFFNPMTEVKRTSITDGKVGDKITCAFCKKPGHSESVCWHKARSNLENPSPITEANFLGQKN